MSGPLPAPRAADLVAVLVKLRLIYLMNFEQGLARLLPRSKFIFHPTKYGAHQVA